MSYRKRIAALGLVLASLAALSACSGGINVPTIPVVHAAPSPNNSTLQGTYIFSFSGFEGANYLVAVGTITFDGNGGITAGSQTRTEQGGFQHTFTLSGNYAVNSDGTGTISMQFFGSSIDTWSIAVLSSGQKLRMASIEPNNFLNGALAGEMEKQ
jgi:hypothetical protein